MTTLETIALVRLYLDDSKEFYHPDIINAINEAQIKLILDAYNNGDERCLRPLHTMESIATTGNELTGDCLFPRACRLYHGNNDPYTQSFTATYLPYSTYINYNFPEENSTSSYPRTAYYTIQKKVNQAGNYVSTLIYNNADAHAQIWYIMTPVKFNFDPRDPLNNVPLSVPDEYHTKICSIAADLLNDKDVGELERGDTVYQNQRLTIEGIGG